VLPVAGLAVTAAMLAACSATPGAGGSPSSAACVTNAQAVRIWTAIDTRINAIELDPNHAGLSGVTTGDALTEIETYLHDQLVEQGLTEREVDRLDGIVVVVGGCKGQPLTLRVTETLVQDDYLNTGGAVDHHDPEVGQTLHLLQEYEETGGVWKESDFTNLDQPVVTPTPSPQLLRLERRTLLYLA
jgi:hypothetical protein